MKTVSLIPASLFVIGAMFSTPSLACGDSEVGLPCDDSGTGAEMTAKWMLKRVATAIERDKVAALTKFTKGTDGFRTVDTFVFCVGPDGIMSAHPDPTLQAHNVSDLHDKSGNYFIRTMIATAKAGQISAIRYLLPKPGSTGEEPKTTYYTKAGDQTCAVGVYDTDAAAPQEAIPEAQMTSLRAKLDGQIPASARADWNAFLEAMNKVGDTRAATVSRVRDSLKAAEAALAPADLKAGTDRD
ncbi:cache domain-containing protein [Methylobacterium sp. P31]